MSRGGFSSSAIMTLSGDFSTNFPLNENPISQGSIWLNGLADGLDWNNCVTTNATDGIHRIVGSQFVSGFDDPICSLKPSFRTFANNQFAQGTIYRQAGYTVGSSTYHEAELHVRRTLTAHNATGYEVLLALNDPAASNDGYAVVRWDGPLGGFTTIFNGGSGSLPTITDGTVFRVEIIGTILSLYRNGVLVNNHDVSAVGTVYASGQPGMGFYPQTPGCIVDAYGFRSFQAGDL